MYGLKYTSQKYFWHKYDETYNSNDTQCQDPNMVSKIGYDMAIPLCFNQTEIALI